MHLIGKYQPAPSDLWRCSLAACDKVAFRGGAVVQVWEPLFAAGEAPGRQEWGIKSKEAVLAVAAWLRRCLGLPGTRASSLVLSNI